MTSAKFSDFFTPSPHVTDQLILFLSSAFWGPPPPTHCGHHIWKPLNMDQVDSEHSIERLNELCYKNKVGWVDALVTAPVI